MRRSEIVEKVVIAILVVFVGATLFSYLFLGPSSSIPDAIRIAAAKCPGIPGGSGSAGPDYINITIDVGLVGLFGLFLLLTVKDMRRRRKIRSI